MSQQQGQQISMDDALAAFRKKCADLTDQTVLLEARAAGLERRNAELEKENAELRQRAEAPQESTHDGPR